MRDMVERLRAAESQTRFGLFDVAADEIERLKADKAELLRELARLRSALKRIADHKASADLVAVHPGASSLAIDLCGMASQAIEVGPVISGP